MVIAEREALQPAEHLVADPPQATKSHADREVHVPGADGGVGQMERQRRRDDRDELAGLRPLRHLARQPGGVRLGAKNAVDEDGQWPRLEQVYPYAGQEETHRKADSPGVSPEVAERSGQEA